MNLPRLPLPAAIGGGSRFFETKVYNAAIDRMENRLVGLPPYRDESDASGGRVADTERTMYSTLNDPSTTVLDRFEAVMRFAFTYEQEASRLLERVKRR